MNHKNIIITGGAGFVGSSLALSLKERYEGISITAVDNLKRRGSELNLSRLREHGISFIHGDLRTPEDCDALPEADLLIDCCAEPSVLAGIGGSSEYVINTNLQSTVNCLEFARKHTCDFLFLSTSRIYPTELLNRLKYSETETRFVLEDTQEIEGASSKGISEDFPLLPYARSLYGATKLASEVLVLEYLDVYGLRGIINRCSVIGGPWQMGKVDQGLAALWVARHVYGKPLQYIGYGGTGKQVRDILHIEDLVDLLCLELENVPRHNGRIYNAGGGLENSVSLTELTSLCRSTTGNTIEITPCVQDRPGDVRCYITDNTAVQKATGWSPSRNIETLVADIHAWIAANRQQLESILLL
ncbi:MAG: NAD-dependent epimerase/dehydratase family protein [Chitinivibrionales bacterium]|nr:NAD-dependent epimerase/dehydratase family protein [Chitinivibrionales bacterium]MBD3395658.1 NAD-dependent epimerase/dehydratase family protein [Chitinivibrionales bacterium]